MDNQKKPCNHTDIEHRHIWGTDVYRCLMCSKFLKSDFVRDWRYIGLDGMSHSPNIHPGEREPVQRVEASAEHVEATDVVTELLIPKQCQSMAGARVWGAIDGTLHFSEAGMILANEAHYAKIQYEIDHAADFAHAPVNIGEIRADRSNSSKDWTTREMLIALLRDIDSGKRIVHGAVVVFCEQIEEGRDRASFFTAANKGDAVFLLSSAQHSILSGE